MPEAGADEVLRETLGNRCKLGLFDPPADLIRATETDHRLARGHTTDRLPGNDPDIGSRCRQPGIDHGARGGEGLPRIDVAQVLDRTGAQERSIGLAEIFDIQPEHRHRVDHLGGVPGGFRGDPVEVIRVECECLGGERNVVASMHRPAPKMITDAADDVILESGATRDQVPIRRVHGLHVSKPVPLIGMKAINTGTNQCYASPSVLSMAKSQHQSRLREKNQDPCHRVVRSW